MHTIEIPEINFYRQIPENLGECNREEYLDMSKLVLMYQMAEINERQFLVMAFYRLLNMHYEVNELPDVQDEKMQNIVIASEILRSFFSIDENERMVLVQNYVHNPIKNIPPLGEPFSLMVSAFQHISSFKSNDKFGFE